MPSAVPLNKPIEPLQPAMPAMPVMPARIAEPEKPKAPIPEQHVHLKTILDELRDQCYENAKNPVNVYVTNIPFINTGILISFFLLFNVSFLR